MIYSTFVFRMCTFEVNSVTLILFVQKGIHLIYKAQSPKCSISKTQEQELLRPIKVQSKKKKPTSRGHPAPEQTGTTSKHQVNQSAPPHRAGT